MIYIFHRAEGFYPLSLGSDLEAIANAHQNPGTVKVTDSESRVVYTNPWKTLPDDVIDRYLDLILHASGSALKNYTMDKRRSEMRYALLTVLDAAALASAQAQAKEPTA